mmetsp:Transcript_50824/g.122532  ORF Transcript_50824/g.122532 Transcript_50824/m.122532 type:complete len:366 (+) Transcript_50824:95-1192(+)
MSFLPEIPTQTLARRQGRHHSQVTIEDDGGDCKDSSPSSSSSSSSSYLSAVNVDDFQILAKNKLPKDLYEYLSSGSDNEVTLQQNRVAFDTRWYLRPRVMRPVGKLSTSTTLFGIDVSMPLFVSPAGVHALCSPQGECATARACARTGILMGVSQHSTRSIEDVAAAAATTAAASTGCTSSPTATLPGHPNPLFYQAYILKDRMRTLSLIHRAIRAGYKGIFLTVDSVRFGYREADARNGFNALPPPHRLVNYDNDYGGHVQNQRNERDKTLMLDGEITRPSLDETYNSQKSKAWDQNSEQMFDQDVTWEDVTWIQREIRTMAKKIGLTKVLPLIIKGIMTGEDAVLAIEAGADGHGIKSRWPTT